MSNTIMDLMAEYTAVLEFALQDDDPKAFLSCWREGNIAELIEWWPDFESDPEKLKRVFHDAEVTEQVLLKFALEWFDTLTPSHYPYPEWVKQAKKLLENT